MNTQELTDLEALLDDHLECNAEIHRSPEVSCSIEAVAIVTDCSVSDFFCQAALDFLTDELNWWRACARCYKNWADCWHYRLI